MKTELSFEAHDQPLKDVLFSNWKFRIPRYQRPYTWSDDHISDFWTDLIGTENPYFFGSFIFNKEPLHDEGYAEVIDGQQRMLTVTILIAVLRDLADQIDKEIAHLFQRQDIAMEDRYGKESYRIECGDSTKPFFENYIQSRNDNILESCPSNPEEFRIKANYILLRDKVIAELKRFETKEKKLALLQSLRDKVSDLIIIRIEIAGEEDAYEIFETTNARGVDLSIADLLKNLIFKKIRVKDDRDLAKEIWTDIVNNIQETSTELKKFIRYFWISKYSFVTEKHLFRAIKSQVTDWQNLLEELWDASQWYNRMLEGSREEWIDLKNGNKLFKSISALRRMGVSQCYVLLLSILRNNKELGTNPIRVFKLIEKFTFNYSVICKLPANKVEKIYAKYARQIENAVKTEPPKKISGKIQNLFSQIEKDLRDERPSFETFKGHFIEMAYSRSQRSRDLIKYTLNEINAHDQTGEHKIDFDNVNIEHMLPQSPSKGWKLTKKDIKGYVNKLGNLTLVSKRFNSQVGNKIISEKIDAYAESEISMTQKLVELLSEVGYKWGEKEIIERQIKFADLSYNKIWSY
ncbi:DUF262 domain-containing protein [Thermodesulfobacteriota bacterium]